MEILDIMHSHYSCYAYILTVFIGTFLVCKFMKMKEAKNFGFYLLMNVVYLCLLFHPNVHCFGNSDILKFFISLIYGAGIVWLYDIFSHYYSSLKFTDKINIVKKYPYFCCLMCFFVIYSILHIPSAVNTWIASSYAVNYSLGIGSRFLVGAFLHLLSPGFVSAKLAFWFCIISYLTVAAVISFCFDILIKKTSSSYREMVIFLILLYIASPFCINSYLNGFNFGRLESHTLLLMLLAVIIYFNIKNNFIKYSLITVLTCMSTAIYQGYIFLYYPMIVITMIVSLLALPKISFREFVGPIVNVVITCLSFFYFQFFSYVKFNNSAEFSEALKQMTNMPFEEKAVKFEFFQSMSDAYYNIAIPYLNARHPREVLFATLLLLLPLIALIYYIYKAAWANKKQIKWFKNEYLYCLLINLVVLPQFILNIDWGRWLIAVGTMVFFEIFLLVYLGNKGMIKALSQMNPLIKKYYFFCIVLIIYLAELQAWGTSTETFWDSIKFYNRLFW